MPKRKHFQSGREIFQHFIPGYESVGSSKPDPSEQADRVAEAILSEFSANLKQATKPARRNN